MLRRLLLPALIATSFLRGDPAMACAYRLEPVVNDGQAQHRFFNECGFYEVGYRLEGNTLHFPRGGKHTINETSESDAQALLSEVYGLVAVEGKALIRTKGFFGPSN